MLERLCRFPVLFALAFGGLFSCGCTTKDSSSKAPKEMILVWAGENRQVHVSVPGPGFNLLAEGRQPFSAKSEGSFDMKGEIAGGEGKTFELVMEINTKYAIHLEVKDFPSVNVQKDGQLIEAKSDLSPGSYKLVITGKLP